MPAKSGMADRLLAWAICLLGALAVGVSGFSADSNHPTYLPPSLHLVDPGYLAGDWWLNSASHYHPAFFVLAAALAKLGILEAGLAALNVAVIAAALYACYRLLQRIAAPRLLLALGLLVAFSLASRSFFSAANSYLFTPSLQPSSLAAMASLAAMVCLLERRAWACGLWLVAAGLFHVNFLAVNLAFFGTACGLLAISERGIRPLLGKAQIADIARILGPSLLLAMFFVPLALSVASEAVSPAQAELADWVFFRFAAPFHYYPPDFILQLFGLLCWQAIGLAWTPLAVPDRAQRRVMWAMQLAILLIVGTASALTTFVFVAPVSRLFLWRLAPFGMLLAVIMVIAGTLRLAAAPGTGRQNTMAVLTGITLLALLFQIGAMPMGQMLPTGAWPPELLLLAGLMALAGASLTIGFALPKNRLLGAAAVGGLLAIGFLIQPNDGKRSRYTLLAQSPEQRDEAALFAAVRRLSPSDAQFLVPPDLDYFRLQAGRPIVVDIKGVPMNRLGLIEWYQRLSDVSGETRPRDIDAVRRGFQRIDAVRLDMLRRKYRVTFAILKADQTPAAPDWAEVYRNASYRLLEYRGATPL